MDLMRRVGIHMLIIGGIALSVLKKIKDEGGTFHNLTFMLCIMVVICGLIYLIMGESIIKIIRAKTNIFMDDD